MEKFWLKIITNKSNPLFWPFLLALWFISLLYRIGLIFSRMKPKLALDKSTKIISVGNLTLGGTGKTPVVIYLARYFEQKNISYGIASTGYKRKSKEPVCTRCSDIINGMHDSSPLDLIGDEMLMIAHSLSSAIISVNSSKAKAIMELEREFHPAVILVDDAYQHSELNPDLNLLLIDASVDLCKEALFPLGRLREPLSGIVRADALLITKTNLAPKKSDYLQWINTKKIIRPIAEIDFENQKIISSQDTMAIDDLGDKPIFFFSGIGRYQPLLDNLKLNNLNIVAEYQFRDHTRYGPKEIEIILKSIIKYRPDVILTTQKDFVKIGMVDFGMPLYYLDLELKFGKGKNRFFEFVDETIER